MDSQQAQPQKPLSKTALIGLIFAILGICLPPFALVGLVLGIIGIVKTSSNPNLGGKVLAIVAVCIAPFAIVTTGILAAIAIPNFIKFQEKSKQTECKANLRMFYTAEKSFFAEHDAYSIKTHEIGFSPERGNRYAYFLSAGPMESREAVAVPDEPNATAVGVDTFRFKGERSFTADDVPRTLGGGVKLGMSGKCPDCDVAAVCIGHVGMGKDSDVWSISTADRQAADGEVIPAGQPYNETMGSLR